MEYLSRCMSQLANNPDFNHHPRCERLNLTHMMFADDLLMFARAYRESVRLLMMTFMNFSQALGLEAKLDKNNIYFAGIFEVVREDILGVINVPIGELPFRYLGVPLSSKKLSYSQCKPVVENARAKSWTSKFLSYAGGMQLIKSILFGMQTFWCQIFAMPKKIIKEVQSYGRTFLWTGDIENSKRALVA
ncbi:uncharacterized protein LOC110733940 [Chenopodium quinoa]|uniref:uncharacterized protein LOC110733940 n=1 Tax=Chenopodium quinoa TaxID=63459 RepID=UPI000B772F3B|nr:uncharacterized protein LOC110733940 [Chenopodium quinoa]